MKKKQMKRMLKELRKDLVQANARHAASIVTSPTLLEWQDAYAAIIAQRKYVAQTLRNKKAAVAHICRLWGHAHMHELKPHMIATGLKTFVPKHTATAGRVLSELRDLYTEAVANGVVDNNPTTHVKAPRHSTLRARLPFDIWQKLLEYAQTHPQAWIKALLLLALVTGQRRGDLAKMRFDDVVDGCLRIEQQKKAGKAQGARVAIPLNLKLDVIGMTLADVIEVCRNAAKPGPTLLRRKGGGTIEVSSLSTRFNECMRAVLGEGAYKQYQWPSLHEMRSLAARLYKKQGVDVQTLLGHKHAEMTEMYVDDRGLSANDWKQVPLAA